MSLAIALHRDPDHYALASDSRCLGHLGGMHHETLKIHRIGAWFVAYTGAIIGGQRMIAALQADTTSTLPHGVDLARATSRLGAEIAIGRAFAAVIPDCGSHNPGDFPGVGVDLLIVGPPGIAVMAAQGSIHWRPAGERYWAIGCADGYAMGWLDNCPINEAIPREGGDSQTLIDCIERAALRYPGVGGATVVLEVG